MKRRTKIIWGTSAIFLGGFLGHVAWWLSSVPRHQYQTLSQAILVDSAALAFGGYLLASYGVIVDDDE